MLIKKVKAGFFHIYRNLFVSGTILVALLSPYQTPKQRKGLRLNFSYVVYSALMRM